MISQADQDKRRVEYRALHDRFVKILPDIPIPNAIASVSPYDYVREILPVLKAELAVAREKGRQAALKEAVELALDPYGDKVQALGTDEPSTVSIKVAKAIRILMEKGKEKEK